MTPDKVVGGAHQKHARRSGARRRGPERGCAARGGPEQARKVAFKPLDVGRVDLMLPPLAVVNTCGHGLGLPRTTRRLTSTTRRLAQVFTTWASSSPGGQTRGGRPRLPVSTRSLKACLMAPT